MQYLVEAQPLLKLALDADLHLPLLRVEVVGGLKGGDEVGYPNHGHPAEEGRLEEDGPPRVVDGKGAEWVERLGSRWGPGSGPPAGPGPRPGGIARPVG